MARLGNYTQLQHAIACCIIFCSVLGQESYKSKIEPKIPYRTASDFNLKDDKYKDCRAISSLERGGLRVKPICELLPQELVRCNPVTLCSLKIYNENRNRIEQFTDDQSGQADNKTEELKQAEEYVADCETNCIEEQNTGPRAYRYIKWVKVKCKPLLEKYDCCGPRVFERDAPCTKDWVARRERWDQIGTTRPRQDDTDQDMQYDTFHSTMPPSDHSIFNKSQYYNFLSTLIYSIFFGLVGCDRFCLGHRAFGVFKMISIGGLGIWWIVDIILLIYGRIGPEEGYNWSPYF